MLFFKLSAFYFFYFAAVGLYIIFLPKVLHDIGYSTFDIGIIFALAPLMRFLTPYRDWETDRKSTRLNSSHITRSRMPSSA